MLASHIAMPTYNEVSNNNISWLQILPIFSLVAVNTKNENFLGITHSSNDTHVIVL